MVAQRRITSGIADTSRRSDNSRVARWGRRAILIPNHHTTIRNGEGEP
jgi:hypothetical protein